MEHYLAFVQNGQCQLLSPATKGDSMRRLTQVFMQEARSPKSGEFDLSDFEGCLIFVAGREGGEWIYSAQIIDQCDTAMSAALLELLQNGTVTQTQGDSKQ